MTSTDNHKVIYPEGSAQYYQEWGFSPAIESNGFVFVSGCTGTLKDGTIADGMESQTRAAFAKIKICLDEAGIGFTDIVEITTYHVELKKHLQEFIDTKAEFISHPHPAWTAIGVSELASENALVEVRVIARSSLNGR